jgi:hypothetical protein
MVAVYISSPYSVGDVILNVKTQIDMAKHLRDEGFLPFWPLHTHFEHIVYPRSYEDWLMADLEWIKKCDCVLRLPGLSKGADIEVERAIIYGIPVFYCLDDVKNHYK